MLHTCKRGLLTILTDRSVELRLAGPRTRRPWRPRGAWRAHKYGAAAASIIQHQEDPGPWKAHGNEIREIHTVL